MCNWKAKIYIYLYIYICWVHWSDKTSNFSVLFSALESHDISLASVIGSLWKLGDRFTNAENSLHVNILQLSHTYTLLCLYILTTHSISFLGFLFSIIIWRANEITLSALDWPANLPVPQRAYCFDRNQCFSPKVDFIPLWDRCWAAVHDGGLVHPQGERLTGIAADNFLVIY